MQLSARRTRGRANQTGHMNSTSLIKVQHAAHTDWAGNQFKVPVRAQAVRAFSLILCDFDVLGSGSIYGNLPALQLLGECWFHGDALQIDGCIIRMRHKGR